ncbi:MAG: hypothetical protein ACW98Y_16530 [Candidatus Thorarchaeota archaeon]|jgi:hypothetical protein
MRYAALALTILLVLPFLPITTTSTNSTMEIPNSPMLLAEEGLVEGVPYVWQEMNGFCAWAATSIALQHAGVDADLHNLFALSTIGFTFGYIRYNDTMLLFPGALYDQVGPVDFVADLYGVNYTQYFDEDTPGVDQAKQVYESQGVNIGLLDGEQGAFNLMRSSIDAGIPLLISVDPIWLPADDYDFLRETGAAGGGHGVLIVGYNDTSGSATILDPGVGSFGANFGYPLDGRGNYTEILYTALIQAWSSRYWITSTFIPQGTPVVDISDQIGMMVRDKLLGVGTTYAPSSANAFIWSFGESGFRQMSEDFTPSGLLDYFSIFSSSAFDSAEDERLFKSALLVVLGLGVETTISLQYLSYRAALERLPAFMSDKNLDSFLSAAEDALPHMNALSTNSTLIYPGNLSHIEGLISTTFYDIGQEYNSTADLETALNNHATELSEISNHLLGIADSWLAAGNSLAEIWSNNPFVLYGPWIAVGAFAVGVIIVVVLVKIRGTPSQ